MNSTRINFRRFAARAVALTSAALASIVLSTSAANAAGWQLIYNDADACADGAILDSDNNGYPNDIYIDFDNDCRWDVRQWNSWGHDSFHESMSFDLNEDGWLEVYLVDTNQVSGFDYYYVDANGDHRWDGGPRPIVASNVYNVQRDMAQAGVNIGGILGGNWVQNPYL